MASMEKPKVGIVLGSASDLPAAAEAERVLKEFGVPYWLTVASAHRTPARVSKFVADAEKAGAQVFIAAAGGAAALPGAVAAETARPVIGIPVESASLKGLDSLLSIVQMPGGVPVAAMAIGGGGARNAGLLAVQILSLGDSALAKRLADYRRRQAEAVKTAASDLSRSRPGSREIYLG